MIRKIYCEITGFLKKNVNKKYRKTTMIFLPTTKNIVGVPVPKIKKFAALIHKKYGKNLAYPDLLKLCGILFKTGARENIVIAIELLSRSRLQFSKQLWNKIRHWSGYIDNWETCDRLTWHIISKLFLQNPGIIKQLVEYAHSGNLWKRRIAVSTMASLNQQKKYYPKETAQICGILENDTEPMVKKAVSWALRELNKRISI